MSETPVVTSVPPIPTEMKKSSFAKKEIVVGVALLVAAVTGIVFLKGKVDDHIAEVAENSHSTDASD